MIYTAPHQKIEDKNKLLEFIKEHSFATLLSVNNSIIEHISKIPLLIKLNNGEIYLEGHLAKTNSHWKFLKENSNHVVAMFDGAHDYVSPTLYINPKKDVPTWNYSTVIVNGVAEIIDSSQWLINSTMELADKYEKDSSWKNAVDKDFLNQLSKGIIGIQIKVTTLQGKFKLSQNQDKQSRDNVIKHFEKTNMALAKEMKKA